MTVAFWQGYVVNVCVFIVYLQMNTFSDIYHYSSMEDVFDSFFTYLIQWVWRHLLTKMAVQMIELSWSSKLINFLISNQVSITLTPNCSSNIIL